MLPSRTSHSLPCRPFGGGQVSQLVMTAVIAMTTPAVFGIVVARQSYTLVGEPLPLG
ncbi:hypothetical protein OH807_40575 [Kitasatospora sp. NBC_01560]|uniref:hypothetical protein n=1 Tax=Kitasatospora sp. NBC_01560 TaxID=2975965 RepID=UPI003866C2C5